MVLPVDMMGGSVRLLSRSAPVIEVGEAFRSRRCNRKPFRQQAHLLRYADERGMCGKAHLQHWCVDWGGSEAISSSNQEHLMVRLGTAHSVELVLCLEVFVWSVLLYLMWQNLDLAQIAFQACRIWLSTKERKKVSTNRNIFHTYDKATRDLTWSM